MRMDAVVLAGGRSSRLAGADKAQLLYRGTSLLDRAIAAAIDAGARRIAIVGSDSLVPEHADPGQLVFAREDPPFGGPAAGLAAGIAALDNAELNDAARHAEGQADAAAALLLVLACDLPQVARAVPSLLAALPLSDGTDGVMLVDADERTQPLTAVYRWSSLHTAAADRRTRNDLDGLPMRRLIGALNLVTVAAPTGSTDDIDTPADAARFGIALHTRGDTNARATGTTEQQERQTNRNNRPTGTRPRSTPCPIDTMTTNCWKPGVPD
ncbi:NTP transferase domain-containing protein [Rathayibacter soli]|uniref:NTP transferase domain-containing protein n=1 Tax=Rathayibacter soli TaxID=3144168 RepID=UPI0027E5A7B9|nr:NTP transferase domain-containing protein [Glaciibacter superstes]